MADAKMRTERAGAAVRNLRSFLVIPAIRHREFLSHMLETVPKGAWPDAIILDLEDSIPEARKHEARAILADTLPGLIARLDGAVALLVKINGSDTIQYRDDLRLVGEFVSHGVGIALAKTETIQDLDDAFSLTGTPPAVPVFPAIETVKGYDDREALLGHAAANGVTHVAFGAGDMATDLGVERDYSLDVLRAVLVGLILSCRRHGLRLTDSPSRAIPKTISERAWQDVLREECRWDARNGITAKIAIHPEQVPILHEELDSERKRAWARQVVADFAKQPDRRSVVSSADGRYMGTPTLKLAKRILGIS
ncbi:MAG: hypothetical protein GC191_12045 [Azospirillum sp.]|nr:hypothetical protein [Azospirillum sp.]